MTETFYDLLDVPEDASGEAIDRAFRRQAREHHPDRNDDPDATERMQRINRARAVLADPEERRRYDRLGHEAYLDGRQSGVDETEARSRDGATGTDARDGPNRRRAGSTRGRRRSTRSGRRSRQSGTDPFGAGDPFETGAFWGDPTGATDSTDPFDLGADFDPEWSDAADGFDPGDFDPDGFDPGEGFDRDPGNSEDPWDNSWARGDAPDDPGRTAETTEAGSTGDQSPGGNPKRPFDSPWTRVATAWSIRGVASLVLASVLLRGVAAVGDVAPGSVVGIGVVVVAVLVAFLGVEVTVGVR